MSLEDLAAPCSTSEQVVARPFATRATVVENLPNLPAII